MAFLILSLVLTLIRFNLVQITSAISFLRCALLFNPSWIRSVSLPDSLCHQAFAYKTMVAAVLPHRAELFPPFHFATRPTNSVRTYKGRTYKGLEAIRAILRHRSYNH